MLAALPASVRQQARDGYRLFRANPNHPGLRFKMVATPPPTYSVRIGAGHRAVGVLDGGTAVWCWVGSHADYDRLPDTM